MNDEDEDWFGIDCHCGDDGEDGDDFFLMLDITVLMLDLFWSPAYHCHGFPHRKC